MASERLLPAALSVVWVGGESTPGFGWSGGLWNWAEVVAKPEVDSIVRIGIVTQKKKKKEPQNKRNWHVRYEIVFGGRLAMDEVVPALASRSFLFTHY